MTSLASLIDPFGLVPRARHTGGQAQAAATDAMGRAFDAAVQRAIQAGLVEDIVDRLLAAGVVDRVAERILAGPELDRLTTLVLESPRMEELVAKVLDSNLLDTSIERLMAGEELWLLIDEIARSPSVTDAISHQSIGFAGQVAEQVGQRSRKADARLERVARRMLRRAPSGGEAS